MNTNDSNEKKRKTSPWTEEDKQLLIDLYPQYSNKELCEILHKTEGQLRGMKERLGLNQKFKPFTDEEKYLIENFYKSNPNNIDLELFAKSLGRQKTSISRYARKLGLTKNGREKSIETIEKVKRSLEIYHETDEYKNEIKPKQAQLLTYYARNNHPRGMLNKHHTKETCKQLSKSHIILFKNMSVEEKHNRAMKAVNTKRKNGGFNTTSNAYSRCKGGFRKDLSHYFRSAWEANIARVLNYLHIEWKYEFKRFDFTEETEGVLSYQPDFYLPQYNKWIEVKGWMDEKSKQRLSLFEKYYPKEYSNLILIDESLYKEIEKEYLSIIELWETKGKYLKAGYDKKNPRTEIEVILKE